MPKISLYQSILVESFYPKSTSGRHSDVHIQPVAGQALFPQHLAVSCSKTLSNNYPVGTKFRIQARLSDKKGTPFIYSPPKGPYEVIE